jgi:hypothetical protein
VPMNARWPANANAAAAMKKANTIILSSCKNCG